MLYALPKIIRNPARQLLLSLGLMSLASLSTADGLPTDTPENVGVSSERLQRVSGAMQRYIDSNMLAGTVSLISRNGKVIHLESQG